MQDGPATNEASEDVPPESDLNLPRRAPILLWVLAPIVLFLGVYLTPERLIELGPLRTSLTDQIRPMAAQTAHLEVAVLRVGAIVVGISLFGVGIFWSRVRNSGLIVWIGSQSDQFNPIMPDPHEVRPLTMGLVVVAWVISMLYVWLGGFFFSADVLTMLDRSEGVLENATALFFLLASILMALTVWRIQAPKMTQFFLVVMAVVFFLFAGEEVSWGQQLIEIETLAIMEKLNVQNENNLHNLFGYVTDHLFIVAVATYGAIVPALRLYHVFWDKTVRAIGLPMPTMGLAVGFFLISLSHQWFVNYFVEPSTNIRVAELRELLASIAFLALIYEINARWREKSKMGMGDGD
jgi:hypothetical protein